MRECGQPRHCEMRGYIISVLPSPLPVNISLKPPRVAGGWKIVGGVNAYVLVKICVDDQHRRRLGERNADNEGNKTQVTMSDCRPSLTT
jgi:hypothetical protein